MCGQTTIAETDSAQGDPDRIGLVVAVIRFERTPRQY